MENRTYLCIDLKSFYASVECVERGLDPFSANLVVADPSRGRGAICLAVSPALKALGVKNRCRIFEIPEKVRYITAMPRMKRYMEYSADIYSVYLRYISPEDIHVYSIDECFFDVTAYLKMYSKSPKEMANMLMDAVMRETGICATAGIGTNMFLAKVALDITAKHAEDHIGYLNEEEFKKQLWHHRPITDIWNVGRGIAARLERYGIYDLYGVAHTDEAKLYKEFGINAEFLIDHANGREPCTIEEIHNYKSKTESMSNNQILFEDYSYDDAYLVLKEMVNLIALELAEKNLMTNSISLSIGYSGGGGMGKTAKIPAYTDSEKKLLKYFEDCFHRTVRRDAKIRRIGVGLNNVVMRDFVDVDLFGDYIKDDKERRKQAAIVGIKNKYGKNSILRGMNLLEKATARKRNTLIGGHNGE